MVESTGATPEAYHNEVFRSLADRRRRTIVRILERLTHAEREELAVHLIAAEENKSLLDVERSEAESAQVDLKHVHLPVLVEANLVVKETEGFTLTQHPALQDPKVRAILRADADDWDAVVSALADKRRRILLSTLYRHDEPVDVVRLAATVANKTESDTESVLQDIHHVHLPRLAEVGLVTVDGETISYDGHPHLDDEWLVAGADDTPRAILSMAEHSSDIWTLEGRDNVTERGRALVDSADDELFMMFTLEGTVETACVRRIRDAIDRGVEVYLGTQNQELRDLVRKHAPEVTIWEPQLDWLNLPPKREKVGRLIMADREEIMIGTIGEEGADGIPAETAITGTGEENPLVMLLREMLGSRLDHLDAQSADFRSEIPL